MQACCSHGMASASASVSEGFIIYGATGYSGRLLVARARELGLRPRLCGRSPERLARLAGSHGLDYRVAAVDDPESLAAAFDDARLVLNAAGPFSATAEPVVDVCRHLGIHYLDISGESLVIERLSHLHADASKRGVMIMPAVGFDVVPTDCLAAHVKRRLPRARQLTIAITHPKIMSAGSAKTLIENVAVGLVRRDGILRELPLASRTRSFDYGEGPRRSLNISLADVVTAYYTTGIPNIETYLQASPIVAAALAVCRTAGAALSGPLWQTWLTQLAAMVPDPTSANDRDVMYAVAEARDDAGRRVVARLKTGEAYALTALSAVEICRRVLAGDYEAGFQTPGRVYGPDFVVGLPGVSREDDE